MVYIRGVTVHRNEISIRTSISKSPLGMFSLQISSSFILAMVTAL